MKKIQDHITLLLPDGKISVPILIQYDDGENACGKVEITLTYRYTYNDYFYLLKNNH